jgi:cyclic-di-GMP phosphodiesterase, flagellum assembly factor TipF
VLTFAQSDARQFQAPEWAAIAHMRALGFRFALSQVTDLDMDLEALAGAGFEFVKLDADVFLVGLASPDGLIPSADVCRYLAGLGLALVVEHIDDEDKFGRVYGFGALLGQGQLFGGARVLKAEASAATGRSSAA